MNHFILAIMDFLNFLCFLVLINVVLLLFRVNPVLPSIYSCFVSRLCGVFSLSFLPSICLVCIKFSRRSFCAITFSTASFLNSISGHVLFVYSLNICRLLHIRFIAFSISFCITHVSLASSLFFMREEITQLSVLHMF